MSILVIFCFLVSLLPVQALALSHKKPYIWSVKSTGKENREAKEKKEYLPEVITSEVNLTQDTSVDSFLYGNSVYYHLLKKYDRLDLIGKSIEEIAVELDKNEIAAEAVKKPSEHVSNEKYTTNRFIVKYKSDQNEQGRKDISEAIQDKLATIKEYKHKNIDVIITGSEMALEDLFAEISEKKADKNIETIQPDYTLSLSSEDTYFNLQWGIYNDQTLTTGSFDEETIQADIESDADDEQELTIDSSYENTVRVDANVVPAWDTIVGEDVIVAVIDTGVDIAHEDLNQNIWQNIGEIPDNGIDDDGNGYIDDANGWNFAEDNNLVYSAGDSGETHGTNVSGIIAAVKDNQKGIAGVAPMAKIMPLKVFENGTAYTSDIIEAIAYAESMGARIVNCSWGCTEDNPALKEAMVNSSLLFVCAAGNSNRDIDTNPVYPAAFNIDSVISVTSISKNGLLSDFSNYGVTAVDCAAPGEAITCTFPGNDYGDCSGTSMSAAFVSGEAALVMSKYGESSISEIKERIINSCEHYSSLLDKVYLGNKINCEDAVSGITHTADQIVSIPYDENDSGEEDVIPEDEIQDNGFMELYDLSSQEKAWYNTLVGPSVANGTNNNKYSAWKDLQEIVSPETGDLTIKQTDIHLPGRNGLDLEIGRFYQSNQSLYGDRLASGDGSTISGYSTYYLNRYALGTGWSFNFPSVQVEKDEDETELYYHTGTGAVYHVEFTEDLTDSNLEDYDLKNTVFDNDTTYTNEQGVASQYVFKTADQTKRYFAADGRLLGIVDRFGNEIKFKHQEYPITNMAPNNDFEYTENVGVWTQGQGFYYCQTDGKDDTTSMQFYLSYGYMSDKTQSRFIPVLPNTKYHLSGFMKNQLYEGGAGIAYSEYDSNLGFICQSNAVPPGSQFYNTWTEVQQTFVTSSNTRYVRLEFRVSDAYGQVNLDKVRFDRAWPLISEITDSIGRKVTFTYNDKLYVEDPNDEGTITVTVTDPAQQDDYSLTYMVGKTLLTYNWPDWSEQRRYPTLHRVNNGETDVVYGYTEETEKCSFTSKDTSGTYQNINRPYLTEIQLRNSKVIYDYSLTTKHLGENGFYETHRVASRYEQYENNIGYEGQEYKQNYSYSGSYSGNSYDNETGYPGPYSLADNPGFIFTTTMQQLNGLSVVQSFKGGIEYKKEKSNSSGEEEIITNEIFDSTFHKLPTKVKIEQISSGGTNTLYRGYSYNDWGGMASETRALTQVQWDDAGIKSKHTINYTYDSLFKFLTSKTYWQSSDIQLTESSVYDSLGRLTSTTNAKSETTLYSYEDSSYPGNLTTQTINLSGGKISQKTFDYSGAYNAFPTMITDYYTENEVQETSSTYHTYEYIWGNILTTTDDLNNTTTYAYDSQGRPEKITYPSTVVEGGEIEVEDNFEYGDYSLSELSNKYTFRVYNYKTWTPLGQSTPTTFVQSKGYYDDHGNLLLTENYDFDRQIYITNINSFNTYGQILTTREDANSSNILTSYDLDEWNRLESVTDDQGNMQEFVYDIYNRTKLTYFMPYGGTAENHYKEAYDQWGRIISRKGYPDGYGGTAIEEQYGYDYLGNVTSLTDARNNTTQFQYDALNRLKKVINPLNEEVDYDYGRLGNLISVQQYEGTQTYTTTKTYDERGLLISKQPPAGNATTISYNTVGLPEQITDAGLKVTTMQYDHSNRLKETWVGQYGYKYFYNPLGVVEKCEVWNNGQQGENLYYDYYSTGLTKERSIAGYTTQFQYDVRGNRTSVTDPFTYTVNYQYNRLNRVENVNDGNKSFIYEYYKDGMIKKVTYPQVGGLTFKTEYTYDNINRLTTITNTKGTTVLSKYSYEYDNNGNITSITENDTTTTQYEYDALNRLSKTTRPLGNETTYTYDSRGNREQTSGEKIDETSIIEGGFTYNSWDKMSSFSDGSDTYSYEYDPEGLRTKKISTSETTRYHTDNSGRVIAESNASDQVTAQNIWGHKVLARKVSSAYYYYLYNGHGDVVQIMDENGNIVNSYTYDEWGNILSKTEGISNPIKYAGEYFDEESELYYLRARYYDPATSRMLTRDTYEGDITNPLSLNFYTYCSNNPLIYVDPSGHSAANAQWDANQYSYLSYMSEHDPDQGNRIWAAQELAANNVYIDPSESGKVYTNAEVWAARNPGSGSSGGPSNDASIAALNGATGIWPVNDTKIKVFQEFNSYRSNGTRHWDGIDITQPGIGGKQVVTAFPGKVVYSGNKKPGEVNSAYGEYIQVESTINGVTFTTTYAHLQENSRLVTTGQILNAGEPIGKVGHTGRVIGNPGDHLHFGCKLSNGTQFDPMIFKYTQPY